jgi:hypothetical protein
VKFIRFLFPLVAGAFLGLLMLESDFWLSYFFSISLGIEGFSFLLLRASVLVLVGTIAAMITFRISARAIVALGTSLLILLWYYLYIVVRIYEANTFAFYTVITDPLFASFLPIVLGYLLGYWRSGHVSTA